MKLRFTLTLAFFVKIYAVNSQTFYSTYQVKSVDSKPVNPKPVTFDYFPSTTKKADPINESRYNYELNDSRKTSQEMRVTGYYAEGYGENAVWKKISLKINIETDRLGRDVLNVTEYKMDYSNYWTPVSYGTPTKTYGDISNQYSYQVFISTLLVYFNV